MAKLTFILVAEIAISALLWLSGVNSMIFPTLAGIIGTNTTGSFPNLTTPGGSQPAMQPVTSINQNTIIFGVIGSVIGITAGTILISWAVGTSFAVIYAIPAGIVITMLLVFLSPIFTICMILISNQMVWPIGIIMLVFFLGLNIIGVVEFIRGGEM